MINCCPKFSANFIREIYAVLSWEKFLLHHWRNILCVFVGVYPYFYFDMGFKIIRFNRILSNFLIIRSTFVFFPFFIFIFFLFEKNFLEEKRTFLSIQYKILYFFSLRNRNLILNCFAWFKFWNNVCISRWW